MIDMIDSISDAQRPPWKPSEMNHSDLVDATSEAISARLNGSSLRALAVNLYGDTGKVGLLADIRNRRAEHVSHAALHDLRRRLGLPYDIRHIVDVPADHDAAVHLLPAGNGTLHTYTVPDNAEVVIVPAGARIVKPKPAQPKRKRTRIDITGLPLNAQEAREVLLWWLFRDKRDDWPDWLTRPQAEDTGTDPAEVAAVLARLE